MSLPINDDNAALFLALSGQQQFAGGANTLGYEHHDPRTQEAAASAAMQHQSSAGYHSLNATQQYPEFADADAYGQHHHQHHYQQQYHQYHQQQQQQYVDHRAYDHSAYERALALSEQQEQPQEEPQEDKAQDEQDGNDVTRVRVRVNGTLRNGHCEAVLPNEASNNHWPAAGHQQPKR